MSKNDKLYIQRNMTISHFTSLMPLSFYIDNELINSFKLKARCVNIIHL